VLIHLRKIHAKHGIRPAKFFIWNGSALYLGTVEDASLHAHHALQVAVGINRSFILETPERSFECRSVVIAPDQAHRFHGAGDEQAIILVDPQSTIAQGLEAGICSGAGVKEFDIATIRPFVEQMRAALEQCQGCENMKARCWEILSRLKGGSGKPVTIDSRIRVVLDFIKEQPERKAPLHLIAQTVGLSESRIAHLFKEQIGIPIRRYLLWLRLVQAIDHLFSNASLTRAAHEAGFADSAHFTRTFRGMFGVTPSELFKNSQFVQVIRCPE
jgi:AraC-like DNA-binding protein